MINIFLVFIDSYFSSSYRATMATYGNCPGEDRLCRWVSHPLSYYERKVRRERGG